MRLLSLDLERYGPFAGKRLSFRADARLHVVFGPNEAGKSSSLAAVTDLLFGVRRQAPDDFLRPGKEMRLGATIAGRGGAELTFWRRKLKPLLSDAGNTPLPDDALVPFLGGLTRNVFQRAFGLDAEALRRSGDELKASDGELGAALFSAASGLRGIGELRSAMEREADGIFAERRSQNRAFYQAADRYEAARKALREAETRAGDLKSLRDELAASEQRGQEIAARRAELDAERAWRDSLRRAAPILRALDDENARLAELGALPAAPAGAGAALAEAVGKAELAELAQQDAERQEVRLREERDSIRLDTLLLSCAGEIERLQIELGAYQKGLLDLPAVEREEEAAARQLAEIALRLGLPDREKLLAGRPDDASLARLSELLEQRQRLDQALKARIDDLERESAALDRRRHENGRHKASADPRPLRERLTALSELRRLAESAQDHATANAEAEATLVREALRLAPAVTDLAALGCASLPSRETLADFAARLGRLDEEARAERQELQSAGREVEEASERLAALAAGTPLPTTERILAARNERDRHWLAARTALFGEALSGSALADAVSGFEAARAEADTLADAAIGDARRLAAHGEASRARTRSDALVTRHGERLGALERQREAVQAQWARLWAHSGIVPLSPAEMAGWLQSVAALLDRHGHMLARREQERAIIAQIDRARPDLVALLAELGLPAMPGLSVASELKRAEADLERMTQDWQAAREAQALLVDLETRVAKAETGAQALRAEQDAWQSAFRAALPAIGLSDSAAPPEARASLAAWREVPALASESERLRRRVSGIRRDAARFTQDVAALATALSSDPGERPEPALRQIGQRLTLMREARAKSEATGRRVLEAQAAALAAFDLRESAQRAVAALAGGLGLAVEAPLGELGAKLAQRDAIAESLRRLRGELANATDGRDESALRAALAGHDPDVAAAEIDRIDREAARLEVESREAYAVAKTLGARIDGLGGAIAAEVAVQQRRGAESEMLEAAREWAVLRIGAMMIGTAMTRERQSRQEPLMNRAGELFATLTDGAFIGLGQSFDAQDVPHLVGRRRGNAELDVAAMSEGTRDQLYLALRLAYLEDYATRAEPPPFLADDLFASFDDARTESGLKALAQIGGTVQPILFTHHRFVVETAMRELGDAVDVLRLA